MVDKVGIWYTINKTGTWYIVDNVEIQYTVDKEVYFMSKYHWSLVNNKFDNKIDRI